MARTSLQFPKACILLRMQTKEQLSRNRQLLWLLAEATRLRDLHFDSNFTDLDWDLRAAPFTCPTGALRVLRLGTFVNTPPPEVAAAVAWTQPQLTCLRLSWSGCHAVAAASPAEPPLPSANSSPVADPCDDEEPPARTLGPSVFPEALLALTALKYLELGKLNSPACVKGSSSGPPFALPDAISRLASLRHLFLPDSQASVPTALCPKICVPWPETLTLQSDQQCTFLRYTR